MADINVFTQEYQKFKSTFKNTSYDNENDEYLCMNEDYEVIDFDKLIEYMYPNSNLRPKTFDAIYIEDNKIYLIEFKNEKKPDKKEIEGKLVAGKKELDKIFSSLNIARSKYKFVFCLVYNKYKPKHERYKQGLYKSITFEFLNRHKKNSFIDEVFTEDVDFFTTQFKKKFQKELKC